MRIRSALAAAVVAAVSLAGCGGGDSDPAADDGGEPAAEEADGVDGAGVADGGNADDGDQGAAVPSGSDRPESVRDDFPVPFPSGWEIDIHDEIGMTDASGAQLLYPSDAYDDVVAFYDEWFESQPEEHARSVQSDGFVLYQQLGETLYQVSVTPGHEDRRETWVLLQVAGGEVN